MDDKKSDIRVVAECYSCERINLAEVVGSYSYKNPPEEGYYDSLLSLVKCIRCGCGMLLVQEDYGQGFDEPVRTWPPMESVLSWKIPVDLRRELEEARICFRNKAFTASLVMVRRTLEGVCIDQGIARNKNLARSLEALRDEGKINNQLFEWAQELRMAGNDGAHYSPNRTTREIASDSMALAEALLDYIYVLTSQFEEFRARRAKVKGK
ncbi:DUF4145 domain-containing protein [Nocardiopsis sp. B62]|uniref:DUF4145 domain-containing protein n=1 Tax=Nocardiopsis sp. B62 TaxID=2824874 RepID=UPI001B36CDDC|nr:DUF4145 domain-containing protein [Nocardiopsis sp. B62]MBQ1083395.1 DUF4145 domain-containing protein [Nocardiopsis sp. B62]